MYTEERKRNFDPMTGEPIRHYEHSEGCKKTFVITGGAIAAACVVAGIAEGIGCELVKALVKRVKK